MNDLEIIHIIWEGPLTPDQAKAKTGADDHGVYQIYGNHEISGPDTLLYIGQADAGKFGGRIAKHQEEWGRWNPGEITIYVGCLAGVEPISDTGWGVLIDKAEAVLIWKIGVPFNSARIASNKYENFPILIVNHEKRHRLPEYVSTITEILNIGRAEFKRFGPSGHNVLPPKPVSGERSEQE